MGSIIGFYNRVSLFIAPLKIRWVPGQKIDNPLPIRLEKKAKKAGPGCELLTRFRLLQSPIQYRAIKGSFDEVSAVHQA